MAHPQVVSMPTTASSYAKIAAMPVPIKAKNSINRTEVQGKSGTTEDQTKFTDSSKRDTKVVQAVEAATPNEEQLAKTVASLEKLSLGQRRTDATTTESGGDSADSYEEDQSQLSSSSMNKPHSFDTKSLASVTTFAMDDKESIRPDDSASVRAVDDDHPHPGLSRHSSFQHDAEHNAYKGPRNFPPVLIPGRRFPTMLNPPRFGNLPVSPVIETQDVQMPRPVTPVMSIDDVREPTTVVPVEPDEKLMDALASTKDRLALLQLEEKLLNFLQSECIDVLELPPQNSFTRLLTHKLADYYSLAHAVTEDSSSVRIFRGGQRALPPSLADVARNVLVTGTVGPTSAAFKIMRREQLASRHFSAGNSTAPSSSVPSKTTSENGLEGPSDDGLTSPAESTPSRDKSKLTREEREAQYKLARDRIFADFQESLITDSAENVEPSTSMSRSSSTSGKKKPRKQKQNKDDTFEARSAYVNSGPFQAQYAQAYPDPAISCSYPTSPVNFDNFTYSAQLSQQYPVFDHGMTYNNLQGQASSLMPQQFSPNDWQTMQAMQMQNQYFGYPQSAQYPVNQNMMTNGAPAMQGLYQEWYSDQNTNFVSPMSPTSPFGYGSGLISPNEQYAQNFPQVYQHPSTGRVSHGHRKSLFNPQTRSFVPNNDGRHTNRSGRNKTARHSMNSATHGQSASGGKDSLKQKYGAPASLPRKPPAAKEGRESSASASTLTPQPVHVEIVKVTGVEQGA